MANFPTSVSTTDQLHTGVNNKSTLLNGAINNLVTTVTVDSTSGFPSVGAITIDLERISYTSISGTQFLGCTRGFGGTTAVSHTDNTSVKLTYGAEYHNDLRDEIIAIQQNLSDRIGLDSGSHDLLINENTIFLNADAELYADVSGIVMAADNGSNFSELDLGYSLTLLASNSSGGITIQAVGGGIGLKAESSDVNLKLGITTLTTDTNGFVLIPMTSGTPVGTPTNPAVGTSVVPILYDTAADKLWIYNGTTWKFVSLT